MSHANALKYIGLIVILRRIECEWHIEGLNGHLIILVRFPKDSGCSVSRYLDIRPGRASY